MFGLSLHGILWREGDTGEFRIEGDFADSYRWLTGTGGGSGVALAETLATEGRGDPITLSLARPANPKRVAKLGKAMAIAGARLEGVVSRPYLAGETPAGDATRWLVDAEPDGLLLTQLDAAGDSIAFRPLSLNMQELLDRQRAAVIACVRDDFSLDLGEPGESGEVIDRWLEQVTNSGALQRDEVLPWHLEGGGTLRISAAKLAGRLAAVNEPILKILLDAVLAGAGEGSLILESWLARRFDLQRLLSKRFPGRPLELLTGFRQAEIAANGNRGTWSTPPVESAPVILAETPPLLTGPDSRELREERRDRLFAIPTKYGRTAIVAAVAAILGAGILLVFQSIAGDGGETAKTSELERRNREEWVETQWIRRERDRLLEERAAARAELDEMRRQREARERELRTAESRLGEFEDDYAVVAGELAGLLRARVVEIEEPFEDLEIQRTETEAVTDELAALHSRVLEEQQELDELARRRSTLRRETEAERRELLRLEASRVELERDLAQLESAVGRPADRREHLNEGLEPSGAAAPENRAAPSDDDPGKPVTGHEESVAHDLPDPWITPVLGSRNFGYELRIPVHAGDGAESYAYEPLSGNDVRDIHGMGRVEDLFLSNETVLNRLRAKYPGIDFSPLAE